MKNQVAIIGLGWVGKAMLKLFPESYIYSHNKDIDGNQLSKSKDMPWEEMTDQIKMFINKDCSISFVCVPTPCISEGKLDTSAVEEAISWLKTDLIVIRSTVNPGDCDRWSKKYHKNICMQPEYLGETPNHPLLETKNTSFMIIGGEKENREKLIALYTEVYNANIHLRLVSNLEAEIIKLSENRAIGFKVAECQELYDACKVSGVDYYTIRDAVYGDDPRFNLWWSFVFPDKRGFNSKCIPKDIYAWCAWIESFGYSPKITRSILEKNKKWVNFGDASTLID